MIQYVIIYQQFKQFPTMQTQQDVRPFKKVLKLIRQMISATQLLEFIKELSKLITRNIDNKEPIEQVMQSPQFGKILASLSNLNSQRIYKAFLKVQPFPKGSISYYHLLNIQEASVIVVFLPKDHQFSLHNHPAMLVLTKPISGHLQIDSMDLMAPPELLNLNSKQPLQKECHLLINQESCNTSCQDYHQYNQGEFLEQLEKVKTVPKSICSKNDVKNDKTGDFKIHKTYNWQRKVLSNKELSIASPIKGNIHGLTAITDCIFIDILIPDYSDLPIFYEYFSQPSKGNPLIKQIQKPKEQDLCKELDSA